MSSHDYFHTIISVDAAKRWHDSGRAVFIDCRFELGDPDAGEAMYRALHLPGAYYWHLERDLSGRVTGTNGRHPLPELDQFAALIARAGITPQTQVILYDEWDGLNASRAWWLLHAAGYEASALLDGGIKAWRQAGLPLTKVVPLSPLRQIVPQLTAWRLPLITTDELLSLLGRQDYLLIDARAPERHRGETEPFDPLAGHIPGSKNRFFRQNLDLNTGRFLSPERLRAEFLALFGETPPQRTVHYCGSGVTACHNLLAMVHAGLPVGLLYPGSWSEWCADRSRPMVLGPASAPQRGETH
ncbi:MAG: sulfurtransferase [Hydrogenophilus sp.]|nr:sulfurtransferase [Hydrogenophilus sp.]